MYLCQMGAPVTCLAKKPWFVNLDLLIMLAKTNSWILHVKQGEGFCSPALLLVDKIIAKS